MEMILSAIAFRSASFLWRKSGADVEEWLLDDDGPKDVVLNLESGGGTGVESMSLDVLG